MSWIDDLVDLGSTALKWFGGNTTGASLARTAVTSYALNQVTKSINKDNESEKEKKDLGVREQVDPDTDHNIPVVYGNAYLSGVVTDAQLTNSNQTMWYCITLCEKTGNLLSTGAASQISFQSVYWNQNRITFDSDGITVASFTDEDGNTTTDPNGLIKIYPFSGGSVFPVNFNTQAFGNGTNANLLFPEWTVNHTMNDLVFALIRVDYNQTKKITGLGRMEFYLKNTMKLPGDCLYDYATNTRYGAGIAVAEINGS